MEDAPGSSWQPLALEKIMGEVIKDLPPSVLVLMAAVLFFVLKEVWDSFKKKDISRDMLLQQNTMALVDLKAELRILNSTLLGQNTRIENLETDVDAIHEKERKRKYGSN